MRFISISVLLFVLTAAALAATGEEIPPPGPGERCSLCGMFVARFPTWVAAIKKEGGEVAYFDGPREMFLLLFALRREGAKAKSFVTDYYSARLVPAENAWYVVGSDQTGPMGRDLVPADSEKAAEGFKRDHGGSAVYPFDKITEKIIETLE